ncbi:DNA mismatch repair protein mutS, putative, partial [Entamoeba invadens IP1]
DEKIGDIDQQIKDAKTQIVDDLCLILNENNGQYIALSLLLNEFDVLLTFVTCNWLYGWNLPTITTAASPLIITQGRNPIVELVSDSFVPNDTKVDNVPVQIITGPNCSGKSVYLRQVGMNVYLGLLGCGIAAQYGEIPLIKRILTRITTKESTKSCLSAFTTDCSQMSEGLRTVDNECLFLIDEFGKGTDPSDGFALFSATVKYLQKLRTKAPKTLIATHFITVFQEIERDWCVPLMMDTKTDHTNDTIQFLYKLVPGITTAAYGIECAKIAGLPQNIVDRAFSVCKCLQEDKSIVPLSTKVDAEKYYDSLISKFIEFDTEKGDITEFLTTIRKVTNRVYGGKS